MTETQKQCKHPTLTFGSGGYYVFCRQCGFTWVAKRSDGPEPNTLVDRDAGSNGLGGHDSRTPEVPSSVKIIFNGKQLELENSVLTYEEIVEMALGKPDPDACLTVVYSAKRRGDTERSGSIWKGKTLELEDGMVITAMFTGNA
jgi:hypothetical protein